MLLLFKHVHRFIDLEHLSRPFSIIKGLVEELGNNKLIEHFDESALTLGIVIGYLLESEAVVQVGHFKV